jgi:hypothetical protein
MHKLKILLIVCVNVLPYDTRKNMIRINFGAQRLGRSIFQGGGTKIE